MLAKRSVLFLALAVIALLVMGVVMLASASFYTARGQVDDYGMVIGKDLAGCSADGLFRLCLDELRAPDALALAVAGECGPSTPDPLLRAGRGGWRATAPGAGSACNRWALASVRVQPSRVRQDGARHRARGLVCQDARGGVPCSFWKGFAVPAALMMLVAGLIGGEMDLGSATIAGLSWHGHDGGGRHAAALHAVDRCGDAGSAGGDGLDHAEPHVSRDWLRLPNCRRSPNTSTSRNCRTRCRRKSRRRRSNRSTPSWPSVQAVLRVWAREQGRVKCLALAEAHTDFILPLVGEELGLRGTVAAVFAFVVIVICGMCIAAYAPNRFGKLLGFGLTFLLGLEGLM